METSLIVSEVFTQSMFGTTALPESWDISPSHFTVCLLMTHNQNANLLPERSPGGNTGYKNLMSHGALCEDIFVYKHLIGFSFGSDEGGQVS